MAWLDTQVARGHASSAEDLLVSLVERERSRQEWLKLVRRAVAEARGSGPGARRPAVIVATLGQPRLAPPDAARLAALRAEIAAARAEGLSGLGVADILDRVLGQQRPSRAGVVA
ncbi:MAG: hypothetical protein ACK4Z0_02585 [Sphingomonadaceae bacterium]